MVVKVNNIEDYPPTYVRPSSSREERRKFQHDSIERAIKAINNIADPFDKSKIVFSNLIKVLNDLDWEVSELRATLDAYGSKRKSGEKNGS